MTDNRTTTQLRISKKAKEKLKEQSLRTGLTYVELINQYLGLSTNSHKTRTPVAKIRRQKINQPPQGLIDAYIMNIWSDKTYIKHIPRSLIIEKTYEGLTDKGWDTIYPIWFSSHKDHHGDFQSLIDRRLKALVKYNYLTRSEGIYSFVKVTNDELDLIRGIIALTPQKGLKVVLKARSTHR